MSASDVIVGFVHPDFPRPVVEAKNDDSANDVSMRLLNTLVEAGIPKHISPADIVRSYETLRLLSTVFGNWGKAPVVKMAGEGVSTYVKPPKLSKAELAAIAATQAAELAALKAELASIKGKK